VTLLPFSSVNYNLASTQTLEETGEQVANRLTGSGGLSQLGWSHGIKLYKSTVLGLRASYVFGSIDKSIFNIIASDSTTESFTINYQEASRYSDLMYTVSLGHRVNLTEENYLNMGLVVDFSTSLDGKVSTSLNRVDNSRSVQFGGINLLNDEPISVDVPLKVGFGFSYEKINRYTIGLDVDFQRWQGDLESATDSYRSLMNITLGGLFIPDATSNSYVKRINYRGGIQFRQLPYVLNDQEINEFGINFGFSLPTNRLSSIDAGVKYGIRGTTDSSLIRENFFQVVFGLTINDRWFVKRRYD
jgi:hypothetical protein